MAPLPRIAWLRLAARSGPGEFIHASGQPYGGVETDTVWVVVARGSVVEPDLVFPTGTFRDSIRILDVRKDGVLLRTMRTLFQGTAGETLLVDRVPALLDEHAKDSGIRLEIVVVDAPPRGVLDRVPLSRSRRRGKSE
jgi:hypothetical protein